MYSPPVDQLTKDGYDLQWGTNVLGHFYFTKLLLPLLLSTAERAPKGSVRVINTSSNGHLMSDVHYDMLTDTSARKKRRVMLLYGQSKTVSVCVPSSRGVRDSMTHRVTSSFRMSSQSGTAIVS